jgi:hypothetical protein
MFREPLEPESPVVQGFSPFSSRGRHAERIIADMFRSASHTTMRQQTTSASLDASLDMLRHSYRRRLLLAVLDDNPRNQDDLADETVAPDGADANKLATVKTQLHHVHLSKLADKGYIEWNPDTGAIRRGTNFDEIAPLLTLMSNHAGELPDDWP